MEASFPYEETPTSCAPSKRSRRTWSRPGRWTGWSCGDVGYGKTEVALRAAFKAVQDGKQVAVLVPTTVLADAAPSHLQPSGFGASRSRSELLSRFRLGAASRHEPWTGLADGPSTSSSARTGCSSKDVAFKDLGLVVIDEEQRFGVAAQGAAQAAPQARSTC